MRENKKQVLEAFTWLQCSLTQKQNIIEEDIIISFDLVNGLLYRLHSLAGFPCVSFKKQVAALQDCKDFIKSFSEEEIWQNL